MATKEEKPFVFVLMPFEAEFDDIYNLGIKAACEAAGANAERLDEQIFHRNMLEQIFDQIAQADILVAEMTGRNANVFYETGYGHALGKRVVLLTQDERDIPFDLKQYPHIIYGGSIGNLLRELEKHLKYLIEHPEPSAPRASAIRNEALYRLRYMQDRFGVEDFYGAVDGGDTAPALNPDYNRWSLAGLITEGWNSEVCERCLPFLERLKSTESQRSDELHRERAESARLAILTFLNEA